MRKQKSLKVFTILPAAARVVARQNQDRRLQLMCIAIFTGAWSITIS